MASPAEGSVSFNADGSYSFEPGTDFDDLAADETREVSFSFTASDGNGSTDQGTVTLLWSPAPMMPPRRWIFPPPAWMRIVRAPLSAPSPPPMWDTSDTHCYTVDDARFEVVEQDGDYVLKLKDGVSLDHETEASVTVTVTSTDNNGAATSEAFDISVADLNEAVTADNSTEGTTENATLSSTVTATDLDGDSITYSLDGQPAEGSVSFNADGSYSFEPGTDFDDLAADETREVSFSFTASDGNGSTDQGTRHHCGHRHQ